jgi:hypothetical protein
MDEEKQFVTLEELCSEDVERDQAETYLERYDAWIRYRTRVPLDMLLKAQSRYKVGRKGGNVEGYFVHLLRYLLINPRVEDDQQARALLKADGGVMLDIINSAVNISSLRQEAEEEAGE